MKRSRRLALHWKILIGMALGLLVGLVINWFWNPYTWGALGVGDPKSYLEGKKGKRAAQPPRELERGMTWLHGSLDGYQPSAGPLEAPRNAYTGRVVDWFVRDLLPQPATAPTAPRTIPEAGADPAKAKREPLPPPEGVDLEASTAWLRGEVERALTQLRSPKEDEGGPVALRMPEDPVLGQGVSWLVSRLAQPDPNARAGFTAAAPRFLSNGTSFVGQLFLRLLKFIAVPVVLFSLIVGASGMTDIKRLGRIGGTAILVYLCTTAVAIVVGLTLVNVVKPGTRVSPETRDRLAAGMLEEAADRDKEAMEPNFWKILLETVPENPFEALAKANMLQVVVFALLLGLAVGMLPKEKREPVTAVFDALSDAALKIITWIMVIAPYAVFALICQTIAITGLDALRALGAYMLVVIAGLSLLVLVEYPIILRMFSKVRVGRWFRAIVPAQLTAFSTSSSSATLGVSMKCATDRLGVKRDVAGFVLPLGATINMDGTALYQGVAAVFICQLYGIDLTIAQQLMILLTATLASIGTPGVPGVGLIMIIVILRQVGFPIEHMAGGIAVILGVDRILDMCRTTANVSGDLMTTSIVASREGMILSEEEAARLFEEQERRDRTAAEDAAKEQAFS
ncbi:MAG: dicarboxylate/amino acid:cation symporter [Phycisphaeraceae bacterium]|nr:dicarboxylate/amino acid:cation symporter [Phycisphaeraceae bacterium]MCW5755402.1 dicarboxylate/amino acid:cation symporter [Phycisphaeraceae bacterium]